MTDYEKNSTSLTNYELSQRIRKLEKQVDILVNYIKELAALKEKYEE